MRSTLAFAAAVAVGLVAGRSATAGVSCASQLPAAAARLPAPIVVTTDCGRYRFGEGGRVSFRRGFALPVPYGASYYADLTWYRVRGGAFVLVKEELDGASLKRSLPRLSRKPRHFSLPTHGAAGCLPRASRLYQFRVERRAFYVWVSLGPRASHTTRAAVAALLDSMWIAS